MESIQDLKEVALEVNNLLLKYIDIHNNFIKSSGTFWSIFIKIDFRLLSGDAYSIFEKLKVIELKLSKIKNIFKNDQEIEFAECLYQYTKALTDTVYMLFILLNALKEKAEGGKLSLTEHFENNKKYQQMIKVYTDYGEKLNIIYSDL